MKLAWTVTCLAFAMPLCLSAMAAQRPSPDIVLFKARLASFAPAPEGSARCDARFPARPGRIVLCSDVVSPMSVLEVLLGDLPQPPATLALTMTSLPAKPIEVFVTAKKMPDGSLEAFWWDRSACLDLAYAQELGIADELAGIYAARQLSCRGWRE